MQIAFLADYPQYLPTVAGWINEQWGRNTPGASLENEEIRFQSQLNTRLIPATLIAIVYDSQNGTHTLRGTASLVEHDLRSRPDLTPWLAAVYVPPEQRRGGVGTALVQAAERTAAELGTRKLYLFTDDQERWYARMGWRTIANGNVRNQRVPIMEKLLTT